MKHGSIRRVIAAASATAMAGAALVVGGAGVASAAPVTAEAETSGGLGSHMRVTRTANEGVVTYGDTVTVSNRLERLGLVNGNLIYWMRDHTPECFQLVDRATNDDAVTWTPSNRTTYTNGGQPNEVSATDTQVEVNPPAANSHEPPITMTARYVVNCDAGTVPSGGFQFSGTVRGGNFPDMGPAITVERASLDDFFLRVPTSAEAGTPAVLNVRTDAPEGSDITFDIDGQTLSGTVVDGEATASWTPQSAGEKQVTATFDRTPTHNGKSDTRPVVVAEQVVDSSVVLAVPTDAQYGVESELSATVTPEAAAGGTVEFLEDGRVVASGVVPADGVVTVDWVPSVEGAVSIDARFLGSDGVRPAEAIGQSVTVAPAEEGKTESTTSMDPVAMTQVGEAVTLCVTVSPDDAGGTVAFYDGSERLGAADVNSEGVATFEWIPSTAGERTVRAAFSGTETVLASQTATSVTVTSATDLPDPEPEEPGPPAPNSGSLGSLTDSLGGGGANGPLGSLGDFGS